MAAGHGIYQYVGGGPVWQAVPGGADHVAVAPDGTLWAVQTNGDIYHYVSPNWISIPGKAKQVSVGYDGTVYALGLTGVAGGFSMYRYVGGAAVWQSIPGGALEVVGAGLNEFWAHQ